MKYPQYSGELADYPSWKEDWALLVHPKLDEATELVKLRESVPKEARVELKSVRTLADAWGFLDDEFGQIAWLTAERVAYLHAFLPSAEADSDITKFKELHAVWREVFTDLDKVSAASNLDNTP